MWKLQAREIWNVCYVYQSVWRLTRKLQARELPGWTIPRIIGVLQYMMTNIQLTAGFELHVYSIYVIMYEC